MSRENGNEMEQIQKNLERFLDREVEKYEKGKPVIGVMWIWMRRNTRRSLCRRTRLSMMRNRSTGTKRNMTGSRNRRTKRNMTRSRNMTTRGEYDGEPEYEDEREDEEPEYDEELYDEEEEPLYEEERYGGRRPGHRRYDEPERAVRKDKGRENQRRKNGSGRRINTP